MKGKSIACAVAGAIVALSTAALFSKANASAKPNPNKPESYYKYAESIGLVEIVNANDPNAGDKITNRNGKLIIERCIGKVISAETGDGCVLGGDPEYNYISYMDVPNIQNGDVICTYFVYNTESSEPDDILYRFDYVIDRTK
jgi:hypothetical protein